MGTPPDDDCLFCKIARREVDAEIVYEGTETVAFKDINPQADLHVLIIPKKHIATLNDARAEDVELLGKLFLVAKTIAAEEGYDESGYRLVLNTNRDAGQMVFHIHLHLMAGRSFTWPPG